MLRIKTIKAILKSIYSGLWRILLVLQVDKILLPVKPQTDSYLFILPYMGLGGIEAQTLHLASRLKTDGHKVIFITTVDRQHERRAAFADISPQIFSLGKWRLSEKNKATALARFMKRLQPGMVIMLHPWEAGYLAIQQLGDDQKFPVVEIIAGAGDKQEVAMRTKSMPLVLDRLAMIIAVSKATANFAIKHYGLPADLVKVINNGVAIGPAETKTFHSPPKILWAGRLSKEKRIDVALQTLVIVQRNHPAITLTVAGSGAGLENAKVKARELGLAENVTFLGLAEDMPSLYKAHDMLWITSESEGLPLVQLEAMERQLLVVSTDCGGVSEAIDSPRNGLLVDLSNDAQKQAIAMAEVTEKVINYPTTKKQAIGQAARETVKKNFSLDSHIKAYLKLLKEVQ